MERPIRNSAKALVIRENKVLAMKIREENGESWYVLPGGGQEPEESLLDAVRREVAEEAGIAVEPQELAFVIEGIHGESFHRVDLVFLCRYVSELPGGELCPDTRQAGMEWLDIHTLNRQPLYPSKLRRPVMELWEGTPHKIYLGNEEIGEPEHRD